MVADLGMALDDDKLLRGQFARVQEDVVRGYRSCPHQTAVWSAVSKPASRAGLADGVSLDKESDRTVGPSFAAHPAVLARPVKVFLVKGEHLTFAHIFFFCCNSCSS